MPEFGAQHAYFSRLVREAEAEQQVAAAELASVDEALEVAYHQVQVLEAKREELRSKAESRIRHTLEPLTAWLASDPTVAALKRHNMEVGGVRFAWRAQSAKQRYEVADEDKVLASAKWAWRAWTTVDRTALRDRARIVGDTVVDSETGEVIEGLEVVTTEASVTYTAEIGGQKIELGRLTQNGEANVHEGDEGESETPAGPDWA